MAAAVLDIDMAALSPAAKACAEKMIAAKVNPACIRTFLEQHNIVSTGNSGTIPDSSIEPIATLPMLEDLSESYPKHLIEQTVMLKLNGGLGTGMGLHDAKSLLEVQAGNSFLDFTAQQVRHIRQTHPQLCFMVMNSFNTEKSTCEFFRKYPDISQEYASRVSLTQNQVPKVRQDNLYPVEWTANPKKEWAPPGHGDLYTALYGSGKLHELVKAGYRYMFVSNGDNLGATLDGRLLAYMDTHGLDFVMEVCCRTESDRKGGHLSSQATTVEDPTTHEKVLTKKLLLRESAQCPKSDEASFQDIKKYKYFNTNNLWVNLSALESAMERHNGTLPLPIIRNAKTVDPSDESSTKVFQLETAMGAAISVFDHSAAIVVPRERFSSVKTCADLLSLRSDAYRTTDDCRLVLDSRCEKPPLVDLDSKYYKTLEGLQKLLANGVPSMVECHHLTVRGPVVFGKNVVLKGDVVVDNSGSETPLVVPDGTVLSQ